MIQRALLILPILAAVLVWTACNGRGQAPAEPGSGGNTPPSLTAMPTRAPSDTALPLPSSKTPTAEDPTAQSTPMPTQIPPTPTASATVAWPLVTVRLSALEEEVLSWLDPSRQPRMEWSGWIPHAELMAVLGERACDCYEDSYMYQDVTELPAMLAVVVASTQGIDAEGYGPDRPTECFAVASNEREAVMGVFGQNGRRWLSAALDAKVLQELSALRPMMAQDTVESLQRATPTPEPSDSGRSYPSVEPLPTGARPGIVPDALRATFEVYPLMPGTRRVFLYTYRFEGVRWFTSIVTQTVVGQWALGDELARVDFRVEERRLHPKTAAVQLPGLVTRYVSPLGVHDKEILEQSTNLEWIDVLGLLKDDGTPWGSVVPIEPFNYPLRTWEFTQVAYCCDDVVIEHPPGSPLRCTSFGVLGGNGWGTTRWFCPGLGYVRTVEAACATSGAGLGLFELIDFQLPEAMARRRRWQSCRPDP